MSNEPKFFRTTDDPTWGETRLRAHSPGGTDRKGQLYMSVEDGDGDAGAFYPRETVEEFRDFLTEWLDATEAKIPTTPGSVIVDHGDHSSPRPRAPRTYVLTPRSNTYLKDAQAPSIPENVWSMVSGPGVPGWETADALTGYLSSGRAEVVYDAGADS